MGISAAAPRMVTVAVAAAAAGQTMAAKASSENSASASETAAASGHAAAAWLIRIALTMEQAPSVAWAFFSEIGSSLMLSEARRGLCILCLVLAVTCWLSVRLIRALLYRIARGVVIDVLRDDQVARLSTKSFVAGMVTCNDDAAFKESFVKVMWSTAAKSSVKQAFTDLITDEQFQTGIANLIRGLTGIDFLKDAVKTQIRETLKDQKIHRALLEGSLEALKPKWMQHEKDRVDDVPVEPSTPQTSQASRRRTPG